MKHPRIAKTAEENERTTAKPQILVALRWWGRSSGGQRTKRRWKAQAATLACCPQNLDWSRSFSPYILLGGFPKSSRRSAAIYSQSCHSSRAWFHLSKNCCRFVFGSPSSASTLLSLASSRLGVRSYPLKRLDRLQCRLGPKLRDGLPLSASARRGVRWITLFPTLVMWHTYTYFIWAYVIEFAYWKVCL
jgi:hypothetical protein